MLFFDNVRVPKGNLLGGVAGQGFIQLMKELAGERLSIAISSVAGTEAVLESTLEHTKDRNVFGIPIFAFQNTSFKLADLKMQLAVFHRDPVNPDLRPDCRIRRARC